MNHLPPEWAHYHACQCAALRRSDRGFDALDSEAWGMEAALDRAVTCIAASRPVAEIVETSDVARRSAARLERSRASTREALRLLSDSEGSTETERSILAVSDLRRCVSSVSGRPRDLSLISSLMRDDGADAVGMNPGAYRIGVHRLRGRLAQTLAA